MFNSDGTKIEIIMQMEHEFDISTQNARLVFEYIQKHPDLLDDDETFTQSFTKNKDESFNLLFHESGYYLNIKRITIVLLSTILDYFITKGMANIALAVSGVELRGITKLKEEKLCIVTEMLRKPRKTHDENSLFRYNLECVNNDIKCHYNKSGICTLEKEKLINSLDFLFDNGVVKKEGNSFKVNTI